ncbi:uncharacterized protein DUF998 [Prauserella shujinwangii]|uniref:Uncharacterized protein DUF998 n=1 Tax=Prauserella shujinwangii TaxID=1453103 RepID=A0A2T0LQ79_9PSEU|nr:DUF998 domain-containing protein [Prauserella shujinwangii]PRX45481.1 uncharacterized protein DUF998 [Prauserella shujinwangii]
MTKPVATTVAETRVRPWALAAYAAIGWALFTLTILHVVSSYDPMLDTLSRYAFTDHGVGMLEASLVSLAIGVVAVRGALHVAGVPLSRSTSVLFTATAAGLVAAALFPASFSPDIHPLVGRVHQLGSAVAFLSLPIIGLALLDGLRGHPALAEVRTALVCVLSLSWNGLALFGVSYFMDVFPVGLTQRLVLLVDFALLATFLALALRAARARRTSVR